MFSGYAKGKRKIKRRKLSLAAVEAHPRFLRQRFHCRPGRHQAEGAGAGSHAHPARLLARIRSPARASPGAACCQCPRSRTAAKVPLAQPPAVLFWPSASQVQEPLVAIVLMLAGNALGTVLFFVIWIVLIVVAVACALLPPVGATVLAWTGLASTMLRHLPLDFIQ